MNIDDVTVDETLPYGKDCDGTLPMDQTGGVSASVASLLRKEDESAATHPPDEVEDSVEVLCFQKLVRALLIYVDIIYCGTVLFFVFIWKLLNIQL